MFWPTESRPVPLEDLGWINTAYLSATSSRGDPTIVWGTSIQTDALTKFVADQRRESGAMISTAHVLIRAVVESLTIHPALNSRVIGRRVYRYDGVHVLMPILETRTGEVNVTYLANADRMKLVDISKTIWERARELSVKASDKIKQRSNPSVRPSLAGRFKRWFRLQWIHKMGRVGFYIANRLRIPTFTLEELIGYGAFVNHLGFQGAPPMISYKPSILPTNSFSVSVTLGPTEMRPVVENNEIVARNMAPLFIRVDHRLVNGYQTAAFVSTLRSLLHDPSGLVGAARESVTSDTPSEQPTAT